MTADRTVRVRLTVPRWQSSGVRWSAAVVTLSILVGVVAAVMGAAGGVVTLAVMLTAHFAGLVAICRVDPSGLGGSRHGGVS